MNVHVHVSLNKAYVYMCVLEISLCSGDEASPEATVISNEGGEVPANGNSIPGTPESQRNTEMYVNTAAMQGSPTLKKSQQVFDWILQWMSIWKR